MLAIATAMADENSSQEFNTTINETIAINETQENTTEPVKVAKLTITNFIPKEFEIGDVQFNIEVKNTGDLDFKNLRAFISGEGFYTYNVLPIGQLNPKESAYMVVMGKFEKAGKINLSITLDQFLFSQSVNITDPNKASEEQKLEKLRQEEEKQKALDSLTLVLEDLELNYTKLEKELYDKKEDKYDVSDITLKDLKDYLRKLRADITVGDLNQSKATLNVALDEFNYQKEKLANVKLIKQPFMEIVRSNLLLISSLAASIITFFALFELLHKKKESIKKIVEVRYANGKTKTTVEEKNNPEKKKTDK